MSLGPEKHDFGETKPFPNDIQKRLLSYPLQSISNAP